MIPVPIKYQASYFADFSDVQPSAESITTLLKLFSDIGLLPTTFTEIALPGASAVGPFAGSKVRLRLMSPDNLWIIDFDTMRVSIEKNLTKTLSQDIGTPEEFARDAVEYLSRILREFPKKGNRLSLVKEGFMTEMTDEMLKKVYARITVPFDFYRDNIPINWSSRNVSRIIVNLCDCEETFNVVSTVARVQGQLPLESGITPFDRIRVETDINTYQGNKDTRFEIKSLKPFFESALKFGNDLVSQMKERIYA